MVSYASTTVAGFPNMFVLDGPKCGTRSQFGDLRVGRRNWTTSLGALDYIAAESVLSLEVSAEAEVAHGRDRRAQCPTVWLTGCRSWYVDQRSGRLTLHGRARRCRSANATAHPGPYVVRQVSSPLRESGWRPMSTGQAVATALAAAQHAAATGCSGHRRCRHAAVVPGRRSARCGRSPRGCATRGWRGRDRRADHLLAQGVSSPLTRLCRTAVTTARS